MSQRRSNRSQDAEDVQNLEEAIKECVRYIVCREGSKIPIKRFEIVKHLGTVCQTPANQINNVVVGANNILKKVCLDLTDQISVSAIKVSKLPWPWWPSGSIKTPQSLTPITTANLLFLYCILFLCTHFSLRSTASNSHLLCFESYTLGMWLLTAHYNAVNQWPNTYIFKLLISGVRLQTHSSGLKKRCPVHYNPIRAVWIPAVHCNWLQSSEDTDCCPHTHLHDRQSCQRRYVKSLRSILPYVSLLYVINFVLLQRICGSSWKKLVSWKKMIMPGGRSSPPHSPGNCTCLIVR